MEIKTESGKKIYDLYFKRVQRVVSILPLGDKKDIQMEVDSHLFESMAAQPEADEVTSLLNAIQKLGEPEDYLAAVVAERKTKQATRSFNPLHVYSALALQMGRGVTNSIKYTFFGLLYLFIFTFGLLSLLKFIFPENVGYFKSPNGYAAFGFLSNPNNIEGSSEVLGYWFVPLCLFSALILYLLTTFLMRIFSR
jgi:hypothetical protein